MHPDGQPPGHPANGRGSGNVGKRQAFGCELHVCPPRIVQRTKVGTDAVVGACAGARLVRERSAVRTGRPVRRARRMIRTELGQGVFK